jgi:hypothetical protein
MNWRHLAQVGLLVFLITVRAAAQEPESPRVSFGMSLQRLVPTGVFRESIGSQGWQDQVTLGFDLIVHLTESGLVNLRLDYLWELCAEQAVREVVLLRSLLQESICRAGTHRTSWPRPALRDRCLRPGYIPRV